jgi:predicted transcriptional regulator
MELEDWMHSITIALPDDRFSELNDVAARLKVAPEDLARAGIEDLLARPDAEFRTLLERLLVKNAELYRRLAEL